MTFIYIYIYITVLLNIWLLWDNPIILSNYDVTSPIQIHAFFFNLQLNKWKDKTKKQKINRYKKDKETWKKYIN
jgi:hypothetical protein